LREHGLEIGLAVPTVVAVGAPVVEAKFSGVEPMTLPPTNTRSASSAPHRSSPRLDAALPATMELASVVTEAAPKL
jgi:hypothetical protein